MASSTTARGAVPLECFTIGGMWWMLGQRLVDRKKSYPPKFGAEFFSRAKKTFQRRPTTRPDDAAVKALL